MRQQVDATVKLTLDADATLTQGDLLRAIKAILRTIPQEPRGDAVVLSADLIGVLEEAEIYHPEGIA